jgi:uncharacterized membrane protein YdjX (TVP38/TMEM64 family)
LTALQGTTYARPVARLVVRILLVALVLAGVAWAYQAIGLHGNMSVEGIRAIVDSHPGHGPLVYMAIVVVGIFMHVPMVGSLLIAVGGVLFDGVAAFAYGWTAAVVGTTCTFLLVRYVARDYIERALAGRLARVRAWDERIARNGFRTVFALRLVMSLAPPLNWEMGLTGVRTRDYVAGTALGLVPSIAATVFFSDSIASAGLLSPWTVLVVLGLIALGSVAGLARRPRSSPRA